MKKVKIDLELDVGVLFHLKSLANMFMMERDDVIELILKQEIKKAKDNE